MGVIRVTKFGEEFKPEEASNPITINPVNNSAESLNIEDVEIINYIENQSDAFIQTGYSSAKEDNTKVIRDIMYFDNKQNRFDGDTLCFGIMKRSDILSIKLSDNRIISDEEELKVKYSIFQKITFVINNDRTQKTFSIGNIAGKYNYSMGDQGYFTNLLLFKTNDEHTNYKARLKTAQIYKNDILVRDYVAAKRKKDGKVGLFDKVENKFYTSPNGTEFIAG